MIREYNPDDKSFVQNICIETASENLKDSEEKKNLLLLRYCDFYIENCSDTCFVAEENGTPVGYVLCCPDSVFFKNEFSKFLKNYGHLNFRQKLQCFGDALVYLPYRKSYPAHLHIDILPEAQRQGNGKNLIDALSKKLKEQGKCGVMLAVSADNTNALKFYEALNFKIIFRFSGTYLLGKKL